MKQRKRVHQMQAGLFDELCPKDGPSLLELPADQGLELEAVVGELLLKAANKIEGRRGGGHDA